VKVSGWIKHFLVYGLGIILMNLLPALMIPIYTHRVTPSIYGVLELLNRSQEIILLILSFGLRSALLTFYQMGKATPHRQERIYSTALQFLGGFGVVSILLLMLGSRLWSQLLFGTHEYASAIVLILAGTYFEMIFQMAVLYLQSELRSVLYVAVFTTRLLLAVALNLVFVYWWRWGLMGILWATLIHTTLYAIATLIYMFRRTHLAFDRELLGEMLRFGAPLMISAFASFLLNNGDRYFLNIYCSEADVGVYGLGYKIGMLSMTLVLMPFGKIWSVTMVDISRKPNGQQELGKIATYLLLACTFSTLGFSLLGPYLIRFFSERSYWNAYQVIPVVGTAYILYSWTTIMDASFYVNKRTVFKIYSMVIAGAAVMLLYWRLIPPFGMMGAAWATLGGYAVFAVTTAFYAQRVYFIHYEIKRIATVFLIAFLCYELGKFVPIVPVSRGIVLRLAATLACPLALWVGGFLNQEERKTLGEQWQIVRLRYLKSRASEAGL
jgi:O-antigen/teichoic acid export membrane protein